MGSATRRLVESSRARDRTRVPCIGRQALHCWTHQGSPWGGLENFKLHTDFSRRAHISEKVKVLVALCLTLQIPWTVARQAPLSMEFSRQEYWSG